MLKQTLVALVPLASAQNTEKQVVTSYLSGEYQGNAKGFPEAPQGAYACACDKSSYTLNEAGLVRVQLLNSIETYKKPAVRRVLDDNLSRIPTTAVNLISEVVPRAGIEPAAFPLGGGRSIHWATGAECGVYEKAVQSAFSPRIFV